MGAGTVSHWTARNQNMRQLAAALRAVARRPVLGESNLTGTFDFALGYDRAKEGALLDALQQQLGLQLLDSIASFDVVVIDHVEPILP